MKLLRVGTAGAERPALLDRAGILRDLSGVVTRLDAALDQPGGNGLGLYIARPDHRGRGHGMTIWRSGMDYLAGRTIGELRIRPRTGASIVAVVRGEGVTANLDELAAAEEG